MIGIDDKIKQWSVLFLLLAFGCSGGTGQQTSNLRLLAEEYPTATPQEIKLRLDKLSVEEHVILDVVGKQFKGGVFRRSCEVDANLTWHWFGDATIHNCARMAKEWKEYVDFVQRNQGPNADLYINESTGRLAVLIYFKCKSGEIDAGSCALYQSINGQVAQMTASTSQTIIDNIGNRCEVGVDANCYP